MTKPPSPRRPTSRLLEVVDDMRRSGVSEEEIAHAIGFVGWFTGMCGLSEFAEGAAEGARLADGSVSKGDRRTFPGSR